MMPSLAVRKNKVNLTDYPYRRDIENRLLMAQLSEFEVNLLKEIVNDSLKISVDQLADQLEVETQTLIPILDKLSATKLFKRQQLTLNVDKEMRKYYEAQLEKFDEDFKPNMEFLQSLLGKIPIHALPLWYAIPRSSDNIFASIVERYFFTPKIYRNYLDELQFDDPLLPKIVKDLYQAPQFTLFAASIIEKYKLAREKFEETLLLLEYHFICCLSYRKIDGQWHEIITPFAEWLEYLQAEANTKPTPILDIEEMTLLSPVEFGFINDMQTVLKACSRKQLKTKDLTSIFTKDPRSEEYLDRILAKLLQVEFIKIAKSDIQVLDKGALWASKASSEQVMSLAHHPLNHLQTIPCASPLYNPRNIRQVEKGLRRLNEGEWIDLEEFIKRFMTPLSHHDPITFVNKGKRWRYAIPSYKAEEQAFIRAVITERLFELGIVGLGHYQGRLCFCLTAFGKTSLN